MKIHLTRISIVTFAILLSVPLAFGQATTNSAEKPNKPTDAQAVAALAGVYEGVAKGLDPTDLKFKLELKSENGKLLGRAVGDQSTAEIRESSLANGILTLKMTGSHGDASMILRVDGDKMSGDWILGQRKGTVELKKVPAAAEAAAAPINLSGEWEAVADAQGQPFPFNLILKIEGERVTGSSSSQLGESVISSGTWKDGQLNVNLESANGVIVLSATVIEGKLSGVYDYAGQLQGKWVAVKKNQ